MAQHNQLGKEGEELAVQFLQELGYTIIETNWRNHKFEIDIIAQDKDELVIIEVKTRSTDFFGGPEEAVTNVKQRHLINGAECYIEDNEIDLNCRFDVISIVLSSNKKHVNHIIEAFRPEVE